MPLRFHRFLPFSTSFNILFCNACFISLLFSFFLSFKHLASSSFLCIVMYSSLYCFYLLPLFSTICTFSYHPALLYILCLAASSLNFFFPFPVPSTTYLYYFMCFVSSAKFSSSLQHLHLLPYITKSAPLTLLNALFLASTCYCFFFPLPSTIFQYCYILMVFLVLNVHFLSSSSFYNICATSYLLTLSYACFLLLLVTASYFLVSISCGLSFASFIYFHLFIIHHYLF